MGLLEKMRDERLEDMKGRCFGIWRGIVTNVNDPLGLGRVKAKVHELLGEKDETDWASYCSPFGGAGAGWCFLPSPVTPGADEPQAGDGVWIMFEAGDLNRPVWVGFWYSSVDPPPAGAGKDVRVLRSKAGHRIEFGDAAGGEYVKVVDKVGNRVLLDSAGGSVTVESVGDVTVKAAGEAKVQASKAVIDAGSVELAGADGDVITTATHPKCRYDKQPIPGSAKVKAGS